MNLEYDATSNAQIWEQLLQLTPESLIAAVRALLHIRTWESKSCMLTVFGHCHTPNGIVHTLPSAWLQGSTCIAEQEKLIANTIARSFNIQLGGVPGEAKGWGKCLAARGDSAIDLRSQIGNALAAKSEAAGLRAIGAVIYIEVP